MAEDAKINQKCIIGIPTCGYAFSSSRMAFIAAPADDEFQLELDILTSLLKEKEYEAYLALRNVDPGRLAFCSKICSKIITSQFCIVLLGESAHKEHPEIKIPNPNVHMEYGLMLGFSKYLIPFQREKISLTFNIQPLDTIMYSKGDFKRKANEAIDTAILAVGTTARPTRALTSSDTLIKYITIQGLRVAQLNNDDARGLHRIGEPLGFALLDGPGIVYFGMFDALPANEVVFRVKLLLQSLHQAVEAFESVTAKAMAPEAVARIRALVPRIQIQAFVSDEIDRSAAEQKIKELSSEYLPFPWKLITMQDMEEAISQEYARIGDL